LKINKDAVEGGNGVRAALNSGGERAAMERDLICGMQDGSWYN
jgi:hypothetical protein